MRLSRIIGAAAFSTGALMATGVWIRTLAGSGLQRSAAPYWDFPVAAVAFGLCVLGLKLLNPPPSGHGPWGPRPH